MGCPSSASLVAGAGILLGALTSCSGDRAGEGAPKPLLVVGSKGTSPGKLLHPRALAVDPGTNRLYAVDRSGRVQLFTAEGTHVLEWRLPEHKQGQPVGIAVEADGSVLVSDTHYHRILRYAPGGSRIIAQWGSEGTGPGQFTFVRDVAVDSEGCVYAGDYGGLNDRIQKFTRGGDLLLEWGGRGEEPGRFQRPEGMAVERRGAGETILVADCANHRVQRFTRDGRLVAVIGRLGRGAGELRYPQSVAVGRDGSLFVSEWGNNRIQRFDAAGRSLGTWGAPGRAEGELSTPWDIATGPDDRIYVADYGNHRVQVLRWPESVSSVAPGSRRGARER
ncbi:MAG: hypothetical protein HY721_20630 [Planctomycetes bacterium]|nr:hypothetical protein [Planctomycetota bacterium]